MGHRNIGSSKKTPIKKDLQIVKALEAYDAIDNRLNRLIQSLQPLTSPADLIKAQVKTLEDTEEDYFTNEKVTEYFQQKGFPNDVQNNFYLARQYLDNLKLLKANFLKAKTFNSTTISIQISDEKDISPSAHLRSAITPQDDYIDDGDQLVKSNKPDNSPRNQEFLAQLRFIESQLTDLEAKTSYRSTFSTLLGDAITYFRVSQRNADILKQHLEKAQENLSEYKNDVAFTEEKNRFLNNLKQKNNQLVEYKSSEKLKQEEKEIQDEMTLLNSHIKKSKAAFDNAKKELKEFQNKYNNAVGLFGKEAEGWKKLDFQFGKTVKKLERTAKLIKAEKTILKELAKESQDIAEKITIVEQLEKSEKESKTEYQIDYKAVPPASPKNDIILIDRFLKIWKETILSDTNVINFWSKQVSWMGTVTGVWADASKITIKGMVYVVPRGICGAFNQLSKLSQNPTDEEKTKMALELCQIIQKRIDKKLTAGRQKPTEILYPQMGSLISNGKLNLQEANLTSLVSLLIYNQDFNKNIKFDTTTLAEEKAALTPSR